MSVFSQDCISDVSSVASEVTLGKETLAVSGWVLTEPHTAVGRTHYTGVPFSLKTEIM